MLENRSQTHNPGNAILRLAWWLFSVPIYVKIAGIGLFVALIFGSVTYYQIRSELLHNRYEILMEDVLATARLLSSNLEEPVAANDPHTIEHAMGIVIQNFPDIHYVLIQNSDGETQEHFFNERQQIKKLNPTETGARCEACHDAPTVVTLGGTLDLDLPAHLLLREKLNLYGRADARLFEATVPLANGDLGHIKVGMWDRAVSREIAAVTEGLLKSSIICVIIGMALAMGLTYLLAHPIHSLVHATERLRDGDFSSRARVYSEDEIGRLARIFNKMAETLQGYERTVIEKDKLRLSLINKIVRAQEEERKSVARELHDQLGQSLSKTLLTFQSVRSRCDIDDPLCDEVEEDIRNLIDDVRHLAYDIRPSVLDDFGLDSALQRYSREISERTGLVVDYQLLASPDIKRLSGVIEVTLYRITQEAVTNVLRHADARNASVILIHKDNEATLIVEDDGCGFEMPEDTTDNGHFLGLLGMKERAGLIGGEFTIESQSGQGTVVRVSVSLKGEM